MPGSKWKSSKTMRKLYIMKCAKNGSLTFCNYDKDYTCITF